MRLKAANLIVNNNFGMVLYNLNKYEESITMFDLIIKMDPKIDFAYHNKGDNFTSY